MPDPIPVYDGTSDDECREMAETLREAFARTGVIEVADGSEGGQTATAVRIAPSPELIGLPSSLYRQIEAALNSGKRHLMLYGPPGTGKTTLAQYVAGVLADEWKLITASADWTSQDIIGGYMPLEGGKLAFFPGVLLEHFDKPLIIDELNRCDIDKVIGSLFTVLSGHATSLPYLTNPAEPASPRYSILPTHKESRAPHEFAPTNDWRVIATINTVDKSSLYQMSYALSRRFAWIFVDVPVSASGFLWEWLSARRLIPEGAARPAELPLGRLWAAVNAIRPLGPAPVIDTIMYMHAAATDGTTDHLGEIASPDDARVPLLIDGFLVFFLPLLDGISRQEGETLASSILSIVALPADRDLAVQLKRSILAICI